jgi:hypothetical protein
MLFPSHRQANSMGECVSGAVEFINNLSFAKKLPKAAPKRQHIDKATQIAGQGSINLPGSQAGRTRSSEQRMQDVVRGLALL